MQDLTAEDVERIRASFDRLWPVSTQAMETFYECLFTLAPETRSLFRSDLEEQKRKFISTLAMIVGSLDKTEALQSATERLARDHVAYGVGRAHYDVVGEALLTSLERTLGPQWTPSVAASWRKAYRSISVHMIEHAYRN